MVQAPSGWLFGNLFTGEKIPLENPFRSWRKIPWDRSLNADSFGAGRIAWAVCGCKVRSLWAMRNSVFNNPKHSAMGVDNIPDLELVNVFSLHCVTS
jgi:hypothetical protein